MFATIQEGLKVYEKALREYNEHYRSVFEGGMPEGLIRQQHFVDGMEKALGLTEDEVSQISNRLRLSWNQPRRTPG